MASTSSPSAFGIRCGGASVKRFGGVAAKKAWPMRKRYFFPSCSLAISSSPRTADPVPAENLDEWMRDSVVEIVRNISQAPFLVQIFSDGGGKGNIKVQREAADTNGWPEIQEKWKVAPPDGVILVEELAAEEEEEASSSSKTWGLLVQRRGADCAACYVLSTSRVRSAAGFCTHFCLAKAKCFGDSAASQLRGSWLLP